MFDTEEQALAEQIRSQAIALGYPLPDSVLFSPIPFAGEWGIATSFFQLAAQESRLPSSAGPKIPVPQRAQEMASAIAARLSLPVGFTRLEAVKGYLNFYFDTAQYTTRVVDTVLSLGENFGRGMPKSELVMVEYAQPNTHHSFHMGHFRNTILGEVLARLVEFSGFETIRATYPGDIGLGVITILWGYQKFYLGQEPKGIHERGQWLLKIYVEAMNLLTPHEGESAEEIAL